MRRRRPTRARQVLSHPAERSAQMHGRPARGGGPTQDTALYNCHCGFVFEAQVLTSVDCPHCGGAQAW
jgi:hypothetical protein